MLERRTIMSHVSPDSFEPHALAALTSLGYTFVEAGNERTPADLWLIDDDLFEQIDSKPRPGVPVVVLSRDPAPLAEDSCVVDVLRTPARLANLYVALQTALESDPRRFPRVPMARPARSVAGDQICIGSLISLSEGGCLFRGHGELPATPQFRLYFSLPGNEMLAVRAITTYQGRSDQGRSELGAAFEGLRTAGRSAIEKYVRDRLLAP